ncbi:sodium/potassium-transporting ATPase subunit beta-1-like isoform X2 [Fopius arisanus]|uniref:Sodium/potassium-transporting ATPase subunit beta-1-like isoform X2 n=1 Tax=Fopius arisanus TaxID=64838 RepID=A0A9R1U7F1_9HYME|nr:PREDICTED: sodium/potassium-transporting ATPase subunit beta-1-like isoform X2 [Fopius arisanus]
MILHDEAYYESRRPVEDLGTLGNFKRFIWNPQKRAFLDRTAKEWGVGFVPNIIQTSTSSPIIWISDTNDNGKPERYVTAIEKFFSDYKRDRSNYDANCSDRGLHVVARTKPCFFDVTALGNCSKPPFGYELPYQPCVFIKFNKRFDWTPNFYNNTSQLPKPMPNNVKEMIKLSTEGKVWLSCNGAKNVDKEHMGVISYFPSAGFPFYYFPFTGHSQYLSPVVAIMFHNLTANRLVNVECHTWAKNIGDSLALDFQIVMFS